MTDIAKIIPQTMRSILKKDKETEEHFQESEEKNFQYPIKPLLRRD